MRPARNPRRRNTTSVAPGFGGQPSMSPAALDDTAARGSIADVSRASYRDSFNRAHYDKGLGGSTSRTTDRQGAEGSVAASGIRPDRTATQSQRGRRNTVSDLYYDTRRQDWVTHIPSRATTGDTTRTALSHPHAGSSQKLTATAEEDFGDSDVSVSPGHGARHGARQNTRTLITSPFRHNSNSFWTDEELASGPSAETMHSNMSPTHSRGTSVQGYGTRVASTQPVPLARTHHHVGSPFHANSSGGSSDAAKYRRHSNSQSKSPGSGGHSPSVRVW